MFELIPRQYWPFYKGILANPLLLLLLPCLYVRSIIMDFLSTRLGPPTAVGFPDNLRVLDEYREKYGKSDFSLSLLCFHWMGQAWLLDGRWVVLVLFTS